VKTLVIRHKVRQAPTLDRVLKAPWATAAGLVPTSAPVDRAEPLPGEGALVVADAPLTGAEIRAVLNQAELTPTLVVGPGALGDDALAQRLGLRCGETTPSHEVRVRPEPGVDPRRFEDLLVCASVTPPLALASDVRVLATANVAYTDHPVVTFRRAGGLGAILLELEPAAWGERELVRFVAQAIRAAHAAAPRPDIRVGMLGYGAIGHEHALAVDAVPGLSLAAVSDLDPRRVDVARTVAGDVRVHATADALLGDDDVDLVVVSTPPDSHADWALRAVKEGKHVVLEKPMALSTAACDEVIDRAAEARLLAVVYQNRRFDPDYRVLRDVVRAGRVGELFHVEAFVGGYGHPCNYWHSDARVSGGAIFDWGSHAIDQLLDLMPGSIAQVTAANHKRHWHDVTNADHSRVTLRFTSGAEAQFIYSDLAAAPKPKWWALGTRGALRGDWRTERVVRRTAIGTLDEDVLAPADSPAAMSLYAADGSVTSLAVPPAPPFAFHRELADLLLDGLPMSVTAAQSRRVVAVMEAAERSAADGARPVAVA
jgi:scyllo-inositol 2-dehydrogenase (NADP+)